MAHTPEYQDGLLNGQRAVENELYLVNHGKKSLDAAKQRIRQLVENTVNSRRGRDDDWNRGALEAYETFLNR